MTDLMSRPQHHYDDEPHAGSDRYDQIPPPPPAPPIDVPPSGGGRRWPRRIAGGAAILALVAGGGTAGGVLADRYLIEAPATAADSSSSATATTAAGTAVQGDLAAVVKTVQPSMVTVLLDTARSSSLGSGVVLSADGLILTNNHVIAGGGTVSVRLATGRTVPAEVVAADAGNDLALVRASGLSGLTPATFGTDADVRVGDTVLAFGAPLGLENTVTSGIVSALDRSVETSAKGLSGLIQTDAAINQGNSGGALVDTSGRVVGINVAIATASQSDSGSIGVGFAIPADTVTRVIRQLENQR
jgi:putative serine protease PepD